MNPAILGVIGGFVILVTIAILAIDEQEYYNANASYFLKEFASYSCDELKPIIESNNDVSRFAFMVADSKGCSYMAQNSQN